MFSIILLWASRTNWPTRRRAGLRAARAHAVVKAGHDAVEAAAAVVHGRRGLRERAAERAAGRLRGRLRRRRGGQRRRRCTRRREAVAAAGDLPQAVLGDLLAGDWQSAMTALHTPEQTENSPDAPSSSSSVIQKDTKGSRGEKNVS